MDKQLLLLIALGAGILILISSIVLRKKKKLRLALGITGILIGLLPLLLYLALSLFTFIKERPFVGNYEGDTGVQGVASLDIFDDNTFTLRSDSCSFGFVQGTWSYEWQSGALVFESSSQNMGDAIALSTDSIKFSNIPVCIKLVREMTVGKTGKPLNYPTIELDDSDY